eukprot:3938940-Rhodomonas_salina.1
MHVAAAHATLTPLLPAQIDALLTGSSVSGLSAHEAVRCVHAGLQGPAGGASSQCAISALSKLLAASEEPLFGLD